jgi:hypothetical protein
VLRQDVLRPVSLVWVSSALSAPSTDLEGGTHPGNTDRFHPAAPYPRLSLTADAPTARSLACRSSARDRGGDIQCALWC